MLTNFKKNILIFINGENGYLWYCENQKGKNNLETQVRVLYREEEKKLFCERDSI